MKREKKTHRKTNFYDEAFERGYRSKTHHNPFNHGDIRYHAFNEGRGQRKKDEVFSKNLMVGG
jgi:hypothetical protein